VPHQATQQLVSGCTARGAHGWPATCRYASQTHHVAALLVVVACPSNRKKRIIMVPATCMQLHNNRDPLLGAHIDHCIRPPWGRAENAPRDTCPICYLIRAGPSTMKTSQQHVKLHNCTVIRLFINLAAFMGVTLGGFTWVEGL
jgi:hypothetical protein